MYFKTRGEEVTFLKKLWLKEPVTCPKCGGATLDYTCTRRQRKATAIGNVPPVAKFIEPSAC